jgi:Transposase, Mutator family
MTKQKIEIRGDGSSRSARRESSVEEVGDRLAGLLPEDALQDALEGLAPEEITGPGGLLTQLAGRVIESALGAELSEHLGYPPGQAPPGGAGNVRNGSTPKTLKTELGEVPVRTPRDRQGSFDPQLVGKRQTRLAGLDERVLDMYAGGMTSAISPRIGSASMASRSAATRSAGSPTRCWRTSPPGGRGRWRRSIRSSTSTRCT